MSHYSQLAPSERILMGPGPSTVPIRILNAMAAPTLGHLDPEYLTIMDETRELLRTVFQTKNEMTMAVSGTGSAGMEATAVNLVEPGDEVIVCINGVFGTRMKDVMERCGATVHPLEIPWGESFSDDMIGEALQQHPGIKLLGIVHAETSTGAHQPLENISRLVHDANALLLVDAVTSLGGMDLRIDDWQIDACYSGTQKCLSCPPGLSPVTFSERALEVMDARTTKVQSWYLDMSMLRNYWGSDRVYHHTAPINMTYALREALLIIVEEGLEARISRHRENHERLRAGLEKLGLNYIPENSLTTLNAIHAPDGVDKAAGRKWLLENYNIEIGAGLGPFAGKAWRIGLMGHASSRRNVDLILAALGELLRFMNLAEKLSDLYPPDRLLIDPAHLAAYESDALTAFHVVPSAVVIPETADEVITTVRFCDEQEIPFVARGSGTSLSGGSLPIENGLVIALNRLNRILDLNPDERIAVVEPGVINLQITEAATPFGLHYAPDPSSQQVCTIGGNVAFNSGGAHCLKYGMTSNHVIGLKAVLATGEVVEFGGPSRDQVGPDLTGLFVGSEGLFGVALEITVRLVPRAECFHTVLAGYKTLEAAGDAVASVVASGLLPGAMEIMDRLAIQAAEASVSCGYPENSEAVMIVELEGPEEEVAVDREKLTRLIEASQPDEVRVARDDAERTMIWKGRKSAFSAVGRLSPDFIVQDGVVPRKRLGEALRRIDDMSRETGIRVANVFHAGDGNLHPLILYDGREPGALDRAEDLAGRILQMCIEMGGSITGEHGIGVEKRDFLPDQFSEDDIEVMKSIRRAFDPKEISNRGKMFPGSEAPSLTLHGLHPLEEEGLISRE